jgi:hypothetical protein
LLLVSTGIFAQTDPTDQIVAAVKTGNAKEIAKFFADNIDLAVPPDTDEFFSRSQAEQILKKFFETHAPKNFTITQKGKTQLGIEYRIGTLETANGTFRVNINMRPVGDAFQINQFRIDVP